LVAVLDLEAVGADKVQASAATDRLREELLKSGRFTLVDRSQMDEVLKEQAFQQTGCTTQECAVQVGKVLGVRKLITGRVTKLDDRNWLISAQLVDVESAATEKAESLQHEGTFPSLLGTGIAKLAGQLAALTPAVPLASQPQAPAAPALPRQEVKESGGISKWWWVAGVALLLGAAALSSGGSKDSKKSGGGGATPGACDAGCGSIGSSW
jgi:TolB-like protein